MTLQVAQLILISTLKQFIVLLIIDLTLEKDDTYSPCIIKRIARTIEGES